MDPLTVDPAPGPGQDWDDLVRIWEETDAPEGCKVEIIEEIVTVSPPPSTDHNVTAELLQRNLYTVIPGEWGIYQILGSASSPSADTRTARRTDALRAAGRRRAWGELPAGACHLPRYAL